MFSSISRTAFRKGQQIINKPVLFTNKASFSLFSSKPVSEKKQIREWHQHKDPKTGQIFYVDLYTEERTLEEPEEFIPHTARAGENRMMTFLRTDRLKFHTKLPGPGYWLTIAVILSALLTYDLYWVPLQEDRKLSDEERKIRDEKNRRMELVKQQVIDRAKKNMA